MKILIADDDPIVRQLLAAVVGKWGYTIVAVGDGDRAWEILGSTQPPDVAILDWTMPGLQGPDLCRRVRARENADYIYLILLTSRDTKDDIIEGLNAGADDFLSKPPNHQELRSRLRVGERILRLRSELGEARRAMLLGSSIDAHTGLLTPRALNDLLETEVARSRLRGHSLGLVLVDAVNFEDAVLHRNERAAAAVLGDLGRRLKQACRPYDLIARYGVSQFLLALPEATESDARTIADAVRRRLTDAPFHLDAQQTAVLAVTLGVAAAVPGPTQAGADLIRLAEVDLEQAEREARDSVILTEVQARSDDGMGA